MMDLLGNLLLGLSVSLSPDNLLLCFGGALIGTLIGVLPGLGPTATVAMLLPLTFYLPPVGALIMLAGIFYGSQYGGSATAILVNLPGESSSVVTCLDGHAMARQGRAGVALATAALASLFAGIVTTILIAVAGPPLAGVALAFGPAEYVSLMLLGLIGAVTLAHGSVVKAIAMILLGLLLSMVGTDVNSGDTRFTFGLPQLYDGIDFVPLAMGLFGLAEIISSLEQTGGAGQTTARIASLWPKREDVRQAWPATVRGTVMGALLGILPGGGATLGSFAAYSLEKKVSRHPERFGQGAIEGVAAPEAANNAASQACFIPMLSLGIPPNAIMALMIGAMTIHGITPGPQIMAKQPELFWGMIASMLIGNVILVILNLPMIGLWVRLLRVPYGYLFPAILVFCCIGTYTLNNSGFNVLLMALFGVLGYALRKLDCEPAPLMLGFVLGPMLEENLGRALLLSGGDPTVFATRPISGSLLATAALLLILMVMPSVRRRRDEAFKDE
ncbi:TctA family transporter [Azospirillum brasilense]|uniref:TctA family transporter n=1 Tax=Azospirillum brasilense TaxID=192 RepID=A0A560AKX1_AZOBR|nr:MULTISPECIES: tripartite tricarboxylate transporter permease [Azospirillum]NUB10432.1 tripartite tricarboxylate transporter permease [Azospirillum baldaniorum]TWA53141.1 TctA family transporter [Azospirillum baldaniorum]TWA61008.1 TctA family transporter [Azospirillum brasilense]